MIESIADGIIIDVRVIPRAKKPSISGARGHALLIRLQAAPAEGAANAELIELIARVFGVPQRAIDIIAGHRSRHKRIHVTGISRPDAELALARR